VVFKGRAYPLSQVSILKDGQLAVRTIAGPDSKFAVSLSNLSSGNYTFSVYGEDSNGLRSSLFTFPVFITAGVTTEISGIFISPTITADKSQVKRGDTITIFGQSAPSSSISITINSKKELIVTRPSDVQGVYLLNLDSAQLELGQHTAQSKATLETEVSPISKTLSFTVGTKNVKAELSKGCGRADLNCDGNVNLVDFSIAAYWYNRVLDTKFAAIEAERLNNDGKITLIDFSIMAYYWTG
ncbi:MAG: dockerin type I repeat-containing protein, partial [Patescibacteria group bacterium]